MKALLTALGILVGMEILGQVAYGSELSAVEVLQPINIDNFIELSRVTVLTYNSDDRGVLSVVATCDSSHVMNDYRPEQRNVAFVAGLRVEVTSTGNAPPSLFGDTLRVVLDATKLPSQVGDWDDTTILAATVQCILVNAAQSPAIKFVALRVDGARRYREYGGVYATKRFRNGPLRQEFN